MVKQLSHVHCLADAESLHHPHQLPPMDIRTVSHQKEVVKLIQIVLIEVGKDAEDLDQWLLIFKPNNGDVESQLLSANAINEEYEFVDVVAQCTIDGDAKGTNCVLP